MAFLFLSLPLELRRLVYAEILADQDSRSWLRLEGDLEVRTNRKFPTGFFLVSKIFVAELLVVLAASREMCIEGGSCRDIGNSLRGGWLQRQMRGTKGLSIHLKDDGQQDFNGLRWNRSSKISLASVAETIAELIRASADSPLDTFYVSVELADENRAQIFLDCILESVNVEVENSISPVKYKDKWNGFACKQLDCSLNRSQARLSVQIIAKSPLRLAKC
jgi:hypothetical protein